MNRYALPATALSGGSIKIHKTRMVANPSLRDQGQAI